MNTKMRDGTESKDRRLGRLVDFDKKSKNFPIRELLSPIQKPRSYRWGCEYHYNQLRTSECVSYSFHHDVAARPVIQYLGEETDLDLVTLFRDRYWEMQKIDPWPGGGYPKATPKYGGTSVLAGAKIMQSLGYFKEYRWAFDLTDLILAIGYKGPAILGLNWKAEMFKPDANGFIHAKGPNHGGHAIMCKGVNIKKEYFLLHNSWGRMWGINGDAMISFSDINLLLQERGEACIPISRRRKR